MIFVLTFISGFLTGAEYPIAVYLTGQSGQGESAVGDKLYTADLVGAFFGAIATSVFLLPAVGIKNALLLITALKGGSLAMAYLGEKR
jgi:predicted membrane-bound spermidine synthase